MCQNGQTHFEDLFRVWLAILGQKPSFLMISIEEKVIRLNTIISYYKLLYYKFPDDS